LWHRSRVPDRSQSSDGADAIVDAIVDSIARPLVAAGIDIVHAFDAHAAATEPGWARLAACGRLGILIGNTRAIWPAFAAARARDRALADAADPIELYAERHVEKACARSGRAGAPTIFYAHRRYGGAYLAFQRLAVAAGLAALAPTQLLVHPTFGPWFALRAVILVNAEPPVVSPGRVARPCQCEGGGCEAAFERACQHPEDWRMWLAMRDACPVGRAYRYSDDQIAYHYTKDRRYLP
jgi:methylmalonic aciduria homocystinuria type C protein